MDDIAPGPLQVLRLFFWSVLVLESIVLSTNPVWTKHITFYAHSTFLPLEHKQTLWQEALQPSDKKKHYNLRNVSAWNFSRIVYFESD